MDNCVYNFNPTIFIHTDKIYSLIRQESNVVDWLSSQFSYILNTHDILFNIVNSTKCKFRIKDEIFSEIIRNDISGFKYIIEDIKIIDCLSNYKKVIGVSNILLQTNPRLFRVGLVSIDVENATINLLNLLECENMHSDEKNWFFYKYNEIIFVITKLFPKLVIYTLDLNTYVLLHYKTVDTYDSIKDTDIINDLSKYYKDIYLSPCINGISIAKDKLIIMCKKKTLDYSYKYYFLILCLNTHQIFLVNKVYLSGKKLYINSINYVYNRLIKCTGINDKEYSITHFKIKINLIHSHNFCGNVANFIISSLTNSDKFQIQYNNNDSDVVLLSGGYDLATAEDNSFIYGTGFISDKKDFSCKKLIVCAVLGPLTKTILEREAIYVPEVYGNNILLLPLLYRPIIYNNINNKIGLITNETYKDIEMEKYHTIDICAHWQIVVNKISSSKYLISASLYGLICADAYNIPNIWLDEKTNAETEFEFKDYFLSQNRPYIKISRLSDFDEKLLYSKGNTIDLLKLKEAFPFL